MVSAEARGLPGVMTAPDVVTGTDKPRAVEELPETFVAGSTTDWQSQDQDRGEITGSLRRNHDGYSNQPASVLARASSP